MPILCQADTTSGDVIRGIGGEVRAAGSLGAADRLLDTDPAETLVVIGQDVPEHDALSFASHIRITRPAVGVVLIREQIDVAVLTRALQAGVREVVPVGALTVLAQACERSREVSRSVTGEYADVPGRHGEVITVFSAKGGCGKTTLAVNLATSLAASGTHTVCLLDLDLAFGDVAISVQLEPTRTIVDGVPMVGRLDSTGASSLLTPYRPGLTTLLAPVSPGEAEKVPAALVAELLEVLPTMVDYVVVDTPSQFSEHVLNAMDASSHHVLLTTPDVPALKNLRLTLDMLDLLSYPKERRSIVLNRSDSKVGLSAEDVERVVRAPIAVHVPSSREVPVSVNKGTPITIANPGHPVSQAITRFARATLLSHAESVRIGTRAPSPVAAEPGKQGAFARLRKGRR